MSRYQAQFSSMVRGKIVTEEHFGVNAVTTKNFAMPDGPYDELVQALSVEHIRFPGGTYTEQILNPRGDAWTNFIKSQDDYFEITNGDRVQTLSSMLRYADDNEIDVTLVVPTENLFKPSANGGRVPDYDLIKKVSADVASVLKNDPNSSHITRIEIGNEYYYNERMTAEEYGKIANALVENIGREIDKISTSLGGGNGFIEPDIAVQAGAGWVAGDNTVIIESMSAYSKSKIDEVVLHYYPRHLENIGYFDRHFSTIDEWKSDPQFGELKLYASEWNVQNSTVGDKGTLQANSLVLAFEEMIIQGVDSASLWGTQFRSLDTRISSLNALDRGDVGSKSINTDLTPAGEMFLALKKAAVGLHLLDLDETSYINEVDGGGDLNKSYVSFGSKDKAVTFGANRNTTENEVVKVNIGHYFGTDAHVVIKVFNPVDNPGTANSVESDPESPLAIVDMNIAYSGNPGNDTITLDLKPGSLFIIETSTHGKGVLIEAQNPISDRGYVNNDDIINGSSGSDTIKAYSGNDTVYGKDGDDVIFTGKGNDHVYGGTGRDVFISEAGKAEIYGGASNDLSIIQSGKANIYGGDGDDIYISKNADVTVHAGKGKDIAYAYKSKINYTGGEGADTVILGNGSSANIKNYTPEEGDNLDLSELDIGKNDILVRKVDVDGDRSVFEVVFPESNGVFLSGDGLSEDSIINSIKVNGDSDAFGLSLSDFMNKSSFQTVATISDEMPYEAMQSLLTQGAKSPFIKNLNPAKSAAFSLGLNSEELQEYVELVGIKTTLSALKSMTNDERAFFLDNIHHDDLKIFLSDIPKLELQSWWDGTAYGIKVDNYDKIVRSDVGIKAYGNKPPPVRPPPHTQDDEDDHEIPKVPPQDDDLDQYDDYADDLVGGGGDCYIVTVVYKNPYHPNVQLLRWYRDNVLRKFLLGRILVYIYWVVGPRIAYATMRHRFLLCIATFFITLCVFMVVIAHGRRPGRQPDHVPWPENRVLQLWAK